jgi:alkylation response protein AidB-like acyl-CoA dehydrogenase
MLRVLHASSPGNADALASVLKLPGSQFRQRVAELSVEALGAHAAAFYPDPRWSRESGPDDAARNLGVMSTYLFRRAVTIYGGSSEIQRHIIARSVLGL